MLRERLQSLSWFMKTLKEPLARMINKEDGTAGHVFDGRFKSIGVLDERALLATCIYIDLNPVAAGVYDLPEISRFTSIKERTEHFRKKLTPDDWKTIIASQSFSGEQSASLEDDLWLCPWIIAKGKVQHEKASWTACLFMSTPAWLITVADSTVKAKQVSIQVLSTFSTGSGKCRSME